MSLCKCDASLGNTGQTTCLSTQGVTVGLLVQARFDSTGVQNFIDATSPTLLTQAFWDANVNNPDASKRMYPLMNLEEVTNTRAESKYQTTASDAKYFIKDGIRDFKASVMQTDAVFLGKLKSVRCTDFNVYLVSADGAITGNGKVDGKLYGIKINKSSFDAMSVFATDTTVASNVISFEFAQSERDEDLRMISAEELQSVDILGLRGLLDVNAKVSAITSTTFVLDLSFDYGTIVAKKPMVGLTTADVILYNVTDAISVTLTSVVADTLIQGRYLVTYPSQTSADVLRVGALKNSFDFNNLSKVSIIVP